MVLQPVYLGLLEIAEIAESHRRVVDGEVESEHLAERWGGNDGRRHDIVVVVALRKYLIVALSEVRSEHQTYEWHLCLVTNLERTFPHPESIGCGGIGRKVEVYVGLCGIVGVAGVVKESHISIYASSRLHHQSATACVPFAQLILDVVLKVV